MWAQSKMNGENVFLNGDENHHDIVVPEMTQNELFTRSYNLLFCQFLNNIGKGKIGVRVTLLTYPIAWYLTFSASTSHHPKWIHLKEEKKQIKQWMVCCLHMDLLSYNYTYLLRLFKAFNGSNTIQKYGMIMRHWAPVHDQLVHELFNRPTVICIE